VVKTFADLGVPSDLIEALAGQGIGKPFAIQAETIPPALAGRDVSGRAPTGSGKTVAFGVPLVANVQRSRPKRPRALVLVPTRELAAQVSRDLARLGARRDVRVHAFYGGTAFEPQIKALRRGVDIAVACPGRLADLVNQGIARLDGVDLVVVDEADRMADMGFLPEVRRLVDQTDEHRQTLLFSATLDGDVDALVRRYQHDPVTVDVTPETGESRLEHLFWSVPHAQRIDVTARVIGRVGPTVVFTRTRHGADRVAKQLGRAGVDAVAIHGNRSQSQRERALRAFRSGQARALVATDVAARGIHVDDVACVVHFDLPTEPKDYLHRSGRTGRAGATGVVVALAMPDRRKDDDRLFRSLEVDVTLTDPDLDQLPIGPAAVPVRPRRPGRRDDDRRDGKGPRSATGPRHKASGNRHMPQGKSPADTRPGRNKRSPSRASRDRSRDRDTDTYTDTDFTSRRATPGPDRRDRHDDPPTGSSRSPERGGSRPGASGDRRDRVRTNGPRPRRTRPGGPGVAGDDRSGPGDPGSERAGPQRAEAKSEKSKRGKPGGAGSKKATGEHGRARAPKRKPQNRARNARGPKASGPAGRSKGRGRPGTAR
jgi:superfamily II DNA/RNA helicase